MIQCTEKGRFFIDVTEEGCPCGCLYCYVETTATDEVLLNKSAIHTLSRQLMAHPRYVPGPCGSLLAFGSHCDLFRTPVLFRAFLSALRAVAPLGNPIQVSTKQFIPDHWAAQIAAVTAYSTQIVVFVSCSTIIQSTYYESKVVPPQDRFASFESLQAHNIPTCLYIKPFIPSVTDSESQVFLEVIQSKQPDTVCVGVLYLDKRVADRLDLMRVLEVKDGKHPLMAHQIGAVYPTPEFLRTLETALPSTPIFRSSACVVAYINGIPCPTYVWELFPKLCVNCQDCQSMDRKAKVR